MCPANRVKLQNAAATTVELSADDLAGLNVLAEDLGVYGNRYNDAGMSMVGL